MAHTIKPDEFERYYLSDNCVGLVDVHEDHVARVAEILSKRHPGIIFLWHTPDRQGNCTVCAVRPDRRAIPGRQEEKLVAAAEVIARNVTNKHGLRQRGILGSLFHRAVKPGWHYTPKPTNKGR